MANKTKTATKTLILKFGGKTLKLTAPVSGTFVPIDKSKPKIDRYFLAKKPSKKKYA